MRRINRKGAVAPSALPLNIRTSNPSNTMLCKIGIFSAHTPKPSSKRELGGVLFCWFYADFSSKRDIPSRFPEIFVKSFFMLYASPSKMNSVLMLFLPLQRNLLKP